MIPMIAILAIATVVASEDCHARTCAAIGASLIQVKSHVSSQVVIKTENDSPFCTAHFPTLKLEADGRRGDYCEGTARVWTCPDGCAPVPNVHGHYQHAQAPYCFEAGTRKVCRVTNVKSCGERWKLEPHSDKNHGNVCRSRHGAVNWVAPKGCVNMGAPQRSGNPLDATGHSGIYGVCRVLVAQPSSAKAYWKLVASNTHGSEVSIEVGVSEIDGKTVTKEKSAAFGMEVSRSVSMGVSAGPVEMSTELSLTASMEYTKAIGEAIESTTSRDQVTAVTVQCPDATKPHQMYYRNPDSVALEYIYQFVVSTGDLMAKTEHFRCHQTLDGKEQYPQCPPQLCGSPEANPYCKMTPAAGSDSRCK